ncbi:MAG: peptidoglycan DD-metalloendopeptidase family protein [Ramlibacter sp.]|jgi:murein DD-endopeptidase MepM/ murein hydrolase activator NlpD|nr:peptidoglycan DD-metalloendopeptidase family protein [Ramlibacter sp.]MCE3270689.1 peptidoglycan DD-metalloendopeptidase family protein [Ramlibacter sp.]
MWRRASLVIALAALGLQGCERQAPVTEVVPPRASLPDHTVLAPGAAAPAPAAPAAQPAPAAPPAVTAAPPSPPQEPRAAAPTPPRDLPAVADRGDAQGADLLAQRPLEVPVVGIAPASLSDHYQQRRGSRQHEAIDILAPTGTPVVAVDDGKVVKLFNSKPGGLTVYQYDPGGRLAYYYAHLQRYADGLREGAEVKRGQVIGYVGSTGNADPATPHLHFAVFRLGTPARWWEGEPVNPYPALSRAAPAHQVAQR